MWKDWLERTLSRPRDVPAPAAPTAPRRDIALTQVLSGEAVLPLPAANEDATTNPPERARAQ